MLKNKPPYVLILMLLLVICACKNERQFADNFHFTLIKSSETNIDFNNKIEESDSVNVFDDEYMYNGSGVGIGDFNNDGLPDIFFAASMLSSKLYINKGNFKFDDVTEAAGLKTAQWCTGVSVVDINSDGFPDIYVCSSHSHDNEKRKNLLFINDGNLHFTEKAAEYGLADTGFSTQAAFFDYDKDGDLDMYLLNHRLYTSNANDLVPKDTSGHSPAEDKLYRNDGTGPGQSHPVFHDVSNEAGIKEDGYGLGVVITDANNDNWPDVYVANDYLGNDLLWLNNKNGTFSNVISSSLKHQSYNSMGVDAADINNDGLPDLAVLDMLPESNERKKMMFNSLSQEKYDMQQRFGYEPAFVRNMLQLNNGVRKINGKNEPFYSEIGQLAGISETDWSWSVLMADFDNDGWKDIHITNGLAKDVTNNDYVAFRNSQNSTGGYSFDEKINTANVSDKQSIQMLRKKLDEYGSIKTDNYLLHNNGNLGFTNETEKTGINSPSISNGAAYVDLDNDGDLDLVVNNMNQQAFIWRNEIRKSIKDTAANFLAVQLQGVDKNLPGIGCKLFLFNKGDVQFVEQSPVRGYSSSVDDRLHFGVGNATEIDSLKIEWANDRTQTLTDIKANQFLVVKNVDAQEPVIEKDNLINETLFTDVTEQSGIDFTHAESNYFDFGSQRALPQKYSQLGPPLATADLNGDGLVDFFVGGAAYHPGKIFIQKTDGNFISKDLVKGMKNEEDLGAVFFDVDNDKDADLLITGGSTEFGTSAIYNHPRLYKNDGKGNFTPDNDAIPREVNSIACVVAVEDYDGDGDIDIFIGGRILPQKYPQSPRSYILQNDHGKFSDVTGKICPQLEFPGLITGALFTDFNNDNKPDLVICGEWMPVRFFSNNTSTFSEITNKTGLEQMDGQWRSLQAADLDNDGDIDFIAGNIGLNNKFHIAPQRPLELYAGDFDENKSTDLIPAYYIKDNKNDYELFPAADRSQLADQLPSIKKKYLLNIDYAKINMKELLSNIHAKDLVEKKCETTASAWIENKGNGKFVQHALPLKAQFAPINAVLPCDIDDDGDIDLVVAGNEYQVEALVGRYDASYGLVLKNDGKGSFTPVDIAESGLIIDGDVKSLKLLELKNKKQLIVVGINDQKLKCFALRRK